MKKYTIYQHGHQPWPDEISFYTKEDMLRELNEVIMERINAFSDDEIVNVGALFGVTITEYEGN
jgi:hypothetical protein